jgi:hypothetical protein
MLQASWHAVNLRKISRLGSQRLDQPVLTLKEVGDQAVAVVEDPVEAGSNEERPNDLPKGSKSQFIFDSIAHRCSSGNVVKVVAMVP